MRGRTLAVACGVLSAACSLRGGAAAAPPPRDLELWASPVVYWDAGADRHLDVALENGSYRTLGVADPVPANAAVSVYRDGDSLRVCGVDPHPGDAAAVRKVDVPPGGSLAMRVDLSAPCAALGPGEYRFRIDYRSPLVDGGNAFSGTLATRHGVLVVEDECASGGACRPAPSRAGRTPPRR